MIANSEPIADAPVIAVRGSGPLSGVVTVPGAKNSVLKLMAATLLTDGTFEITNVPTIADVTIMGDLLEAIGVRRLTAPGINGNLVFLGFHPYFIERPLFRQLIQAIMTDFGEEPEPERP